MVVPMMQKKASKRSTFGHGLGGHHSPHGGSFYSLQSRMSHRGAQNFASTDEDVEAAEVVYDAEEGKLIVGNDEDEDGSFVPRYIPAGGMSLTSMDSINNINADEPGELELTDEARVEEDAAEEEVGLGSLDKPGSPSAGVKKFSPKSSPKTSPKPGSPKQLGSPKPGSPKPGSPKPGSPKNSPLQKTQSLPGMIGHSDSLIAELTPTPAEALETGGEGAETGAGGATQEGVRPQGSIRGKGNWRKLKVATKVSSALAEINSDMKMYGVTNENDDKTNWTALNAQDMTTKSRYILLPNSHSRVWWDMYMGLLLAYIAGYVPFRVSFLTDLNDFWSAVEVWVDVSFGIDIILNFITAYHVGNADSDIEFDQKKIAKRYLKGFFLIDFIATFPFALLLPSDDGSSNNGVQRSAKLVNLGKGMKLLRGLKMLRVVRLQKFIRDVESNYNVHHGISRMFNIVVVVLLATHLVGCLWYFLGVESDPEIAETTCTYLEDMHDGTVDLIEGGWVCREGYMGLSNSHRYVASLYWAFSTLTTVGYGDISANTVSEQAFSMIMMLTGVSWYAYVVGSMSTIMGSFDRQNKQIREKMEGVNTFIRDAKLPGHLSKQVRAFFEYSLSKRANGLSSYDADEILGELSSNLKNEVIIHVEGELIERIPFLKGKNTSFIADCIQMFQPMVVHEGDYIIKEGTAADEMYFLLKGRAAVYYGNKKMLALVEGSYFGEIGCIMGGIRRAGIRSVTTCELQCLSKRNLNILLGEYPDVGDELKNIAKQRMRQVRQTQLKDTKQSVEDMKKMLAVRERRMSEGRQIQRGTTSNELKKIQEAHENKIVAVAEEEEDSDSGGEGASKNSSQSPKRALGARNHSITTAIGQASHKVATAATIESINKATLSPKSTPRQVGGVGAASPKRASSPISAAQQQAMHAKQKLEMQKEIDRQVEIKVAAVTEQLMKAMEGQMVAMLEKAAKQFEASSNAGKSKEG
jgi:CRP-like cAMP-binding protein